tara:strand:+ start:380 stop:661 length:282 start_codon:yes stop_codon:yes gene_type:complete
MTRDECLNKAKELINGDRQVDYGDAHVLHARAAGMFNLYLKGTDRSSPRLNAQDVAVFMILMKISRIANRPTDDSFVDICGYAALATEMSSNV